ncbi:Bifunctional protein FolD [Candidatus Rhabdochlamydia oedothoracis]|uniref:Bifunctional protein FolD n=1 Tax=Candidatus Rhabdochlamydia oedothoracis TaxID=2720720 RepID=A0ABX8V0U7_9BACT|nr:MULTISPECIES: bifunctional methylenetetrahydrofolate dehydrogenase/methenyltetrahydrofolate cyclohydrolase FolD [Rhabdochlamydia]KAG6559910.1 Bifunctional protein FolD protein [Candidatus Rhabdochlamydia sp. W815]MCL6755585.1 bifunctional methylenetetrahydrofolate dehydrogenase/methenyltetrahydrofolate cyclohydrolase FolD [Candidatus Rhabdochlamydia oedothoracis]QYF48843.1 Bifunctional protein FolD [Candidatus Rhabdochlamydia oedothoracis]
MKLIDGISIAKTIQERIKSSIAKLQKRPPGLAFIRVGDNPASHSYIRMKKKRCQEVGIVSFDVEFPSHVSEAQVVLEIKRLNLDSAVNGILVQLPLPEHINPFLIMQMIDPEKDVDGFNPFNMGKLLLGERDGFIPCTPQGIHVLLTQSQIPLLGKHVVIVGRSNIVGKPLAALLMQKAPHCNATVTLVHSFSEKLEEICKQADVLIAAIGKPAFIKKNMVKPHAAVIDVGINHIINDQGEKRIVGDVAFDEVAPNCSYITPVPGGVGPMTISMLLANTLLSYQKKIK